MKRQACVLVTYENGKNDAFVIKLRPSEKLGFTKKEIQNEIRNYTELHNTSVRVAVMGFDFEV